MSSPMRVTFVYPSSSERTGGVIVLYLMAGALAARGHDVTFVHGPLIPGRVSTVDELPHEARADGVRHVFADSLDAAHIPDGDVVFQFDAPQRLGLPACFIQGYRMLSEEWEHATYHHVGLKVCVAQWLVEVGIGLGVDPVEFAHVPPGLDHEVFTPPLPPAERPIDVAALAHPFPEKRWPIAVEAMNELRRRRPRHRAVYFSVNPPTLTPDGAEHRRGLDHRRLATEVYGRTKVFMQASRNEGFGLTPAEAMACGAALVTTDCGGSREYAVADETALVVPVDDPVALADAVERLLDDPAQRRRLATAGTEHVRGLQWVRSGELLEAALVRYLDDPDLLLRR